MRCVDPLNPPRNADGKVISVTSKAAAAATPVTLASNIEWQPMGGTDVFGQGNLGTATQISALPGDAALGQTDLLQSLTYGNGLILWKNFSLDNELYQLIVENGTTKIMNRSYGRTDKTNIDRIFDNLNHANDETLTYTDAARLSTATSTGIYGTRTYTYDKDANRLTETANGVVNTYTYPANSNRLSSVRQGTTTTRAFAYDAAGNTVTDTRGTTAYNYAINSAGRIRTQSVGAALKSTYTYDAFQRLRVKALTSPVSTTHYIWDSFGHIIAEHNGTGGAVQKDYVWLGDTPLALINAGTLYYVHPDHLDRPVIMTNATAMTVAWTAKYDPFGNAVAVTAAIINNQRLPGQSYQIEDGLSYNWHRTYDPTIGRYTQGDPLGFVDGPNIYNYAGQNPVMGMDQEGLLLPRISRPTSPMPNVCAPITPISGDGPPGNNQAQNKQVRSIVKKLGMNKAQQEMLHREISKQGYTYEEIMIIAVDIMDGW